MKAAPRARCDEGLEAEYYFMQLMEDKKLLVAKIDSYYDLQVNGVPVEVKSTMASIRSNRGRYTVGRFDFTDKDARERIAAENIWVCLILRSSSCCMVYGFLEGNRINQRQLSIHQAHKLKPLSLDAWLQKVRP